MTSIKRRTEKPPIRANKQEFPYVLPHPSDEEIERLRKRYRGYLSGAIEVGPEKYLMQGIYRDYAKELYDFQFRPSDVVVASYPKTGARFTQAFQEKLKSVK